MAIGGVMLPSPRGKELEAKTTPLLLWSCLFASTGGLMFGYDIGISGGVTSMDDFLKEFFPVVYKRTQQTGIENNNYCRYNNQWLQLFTSSLYVAALVSTFLASYTTRKRGRIFSMRIAGILFVVGVAINAASLNLAMLIFGRIALGCGVGFANQAVPLYLSEMAPTRRRGALNILFQLMITIGILFANLVNYWTAKIEGWGWRLSLGLAGIPALLLTAGSLLVSDTPNSLIERGMLEKGELVLKKIRGFNNVEPEFRELVDASRVAGEVESPFRHLLIKKNRPQLIIAVALQLFQQFTGINAIMLYAPVLFESLGFGGNASLYSAAITGGVNVLSTVISIFAVDKVGRRVLLLAAGFLMFLAQIVIAVVLGAKLSDSTNNLDKGFSVLVVVMTCTFVAAFAWSWGPLAWLIPSEMFPLETRSAGQSVSVCMNMLFTFVIAQSYLCMLCAFKYGIFLFFSFWVLVMTVFTRFFVPETKNVPIEKMEDSVWKQHWLCMICHEEMQDLSDV